MVTRASETSLTGQSVQSGTRQDSDVSTYFPGAGLQQMVPLL